MGGNSRKRKEDSSEAGDDDEDNKTTETGSYDDAETTDDDDDDEDTAIAETPSGGSGSNDSSNNNHNNKKKGVAKKISVKEAEQKLFDVSLGYDVKLRVPFQEPPQTTSEDVFVYARVNLERCKKDKTRSKLAHKAAKEAVTCLRHHYNAASAEDSKLHLRLYIADCYAGDREARIFSPGSGIGAARLCIVWMLCLPDGSVVLDGGRVGLTDDHFMGFYDMLHLKTGETTVLNSLVPKLCKGIEQRINIQKAQSRSWLGW